MERRQTASMTTLGQALETLAGTINVWRDAAIVGLAFIVIGCLYLYASLVGEP